MQTSDPPAASSYDLVFRAGTNPRFSLGSHQGVTLTAERIAWSCDGKDDGAAFANIRKVNLESSGDPAHPNACTITFADGYRLIVTSGDANGFADPERTPIYRDFVRDLHARLALAKTATRFDAGYQGHRYPLAIAGMVLIGSVSIVVPLFAIIWTGSIGAIGLLFAGALLYLPMMQAIEKNTPRTYTADKVPEEMLP
jgi:hypothetical protein